MTPAEWAELFYCFARHLPGIGGPLGFGLLSFGEVDAMLDALIDELNRTAAAAKTAGKRG